MSRPSAQAIPFNLLQPREDADAVDAAIRRVIDRGWFVLGPEVDAFEHEFAAAIGAPHAVGVGNGTDAIALALRALDIGAGHEVITSPVSAAFSALAIAMTGARPVFVDVDPARLTLDPGAIAAAVTSRTRAIVPVHLYGQTADMSRLLSVAAHHRLPVVEDACQAHLATCESRPAGTMGVAGAFSFYPTKNLGGMGDGGAVVTSDADLAERVRRLRNGGQTKRVHHAEPGVNSRLDEMQAAILRARLPFLQKWTARRRALAARYRRGLEHASAVKVPDEIDAGHVYHLFPVLCRERAALQRALAAAGIETLIHYPVPVHRQPAFADGERPACPAAELVCDQVVSLPLHPGMSDAEASAVAAAVCAFRG